MKIQSYVPYHLGIKLADYINLKNLKIQLNKILKEKKYKIVQSGELIPFEKNREIIASKNDILVEIYYNANAINSIVKVTDDHQPVIDVFQDITNSLIALDYNLKNTIDFYELVSNIVIISKNKPIQCLNQLLNIDFGEFKDFGKLSCTGFKLRSEKNTGEYFDLVIEPKLSNPDKLFYVRAVFKTEDYDSILDMHNIFPNEILKIMNAIEVMT